MRSEIFVSRGAFLLIEFLLSAVSGGYLSSISSLSGNNKGRAFLFIIFHNVLTNEFGVETQYIIVACPMG